MLDLAGSICRNAEVHDSYWAVFMTVRQLAKKIRPLVYSVHLFRRTHWNVARVLTHWRYAASRAHRLPPGSMGHACMAAAQNDERFYLKLRAQHGRLFKLFWGGRKIKVCLVGFKQGRKLLMEKYESLRAVNTDISPVVPHGYLRSMRGSTHSHYRRAFSRALKEDLIKSSMPAIRELINEELQEFADTRNVEASALSLVESLNRIATGSLVLVIFGQDPRGSLHGKLYDLFCQLGPDGHIVDVGRKEAEIYGKIREEIYFLEKSIRCGEDHQIEDCVLKRLISDASSDSLDETVIGNSIYMIERGRHDLRDLLRWVLKFLSDNSDVVARLRADSPKTSRKPSLAEACVMETLRLEQAEVINRQAIEAFKVDGYYIPKSSWVSILLRETHRDPEVFSQPDEFRPERFLDRDYKRNEFSPFGLDSHACIGSSIVYAVASAFIEELVGRFSWEVVADGPRHYGHFHWQPSMSFAVHLKRNT